MVVLNGGGHSIGQCHHFRSGFSGPWTSNPSEVDNGFFVALLEREWLQTTAEETGKMQYHDGETRSSKTCLFQRIFASLGTFVLTATLTGTRRHNLDKNEG